MTFEELDKIVEQWCAEHFDGKGFMDYLVEKDILGVIYNSARTYTNAKGWAQECLDNHYRFYRRQAMMRYRNLSPEKKQEAEARIDKMVDRVEAGAVLVRNENGGVSWK